MAKALQSDAETEYLFIDSTIVHARQLCQRPKNPDIRKSDARGAD
jgi:hypothetical protein